MKSYVECLQIRPNGPRQHITYVGDFLAYTLNTQCSHAWMQPNLGKMIALKNMPIVHSNDMKSPWDLTTTYITFYIMLAII